MSTFLIRAAISQSSSYPILLTRLSGPSFKPTVMHIWNYKTAGNIIHDLVVSSHTRWSPDQWDIIYSINNFQNFESASMWIKYLSILPSFSVPAVLYNPACKELHLCRRMVVQPSSDGLLAEVSRGFLQPKINARRFLHSPLFHRIITLINTRESCLTWHSGKWPLARNPDRSCWHRHTILKIFWLQLMDP